MTLYKFVTFHDISMTIFIVKVAQTMGTLLSLN